jgi:hypothetical protein
MPKGSLAVAPQWHQAPVAFRRKEQFDVENPWGFSGTRKMIYFHHGVSTSILVYGGIYGESNMNVRLSLYLSLHASICLPVFQQKEATQKDQIWVKQVGFLKR